MTNEEAYHYFYSAIETGEQVDVSTKLGHKLYLQAENALEENDKLKAEIEQLKSRTCQSCVNKGKCAIFDNFNIDYCSDWEKGGNNGNSKKSR